MTITINKNSSATILTLNNFSNISYDLSMPVEVIKEIESDEEATKLLKIEGNTATLNFEWTLTEEASSVVSGTGSPVTTAVGQFKYLFDTLQPTSITDTFTVTVDFAGTTFVRTGIITKITAIQTSDQPITFRGSMSLQVGTTL